VAYGEVDARGFSACNEPIGSDQRFVVLSKIGERSCVLVERRQIGEEVGTQWHERNGFPRPVTRLMSVAFFEGQQHVPVREPNSMLGAPVVCRGKSLEAFPEAAGFTFVVNDELTPQRCGANFR
jgi:hypothetical protein